MEARQRMFRLLLLLYPPRFRREYGGEALRQLEADLLEANDSGRLRRFIEGSVVLLDFTLAGVLERFASLGSRSRPVSSPSRGGGLMSTMLQDVRFAVRGFLKRPGFTVVAVASLALGVGANTAIFSVANGVLFKPLPYDEPDRVVQLLGTIRGQLSRRHSWLAYPEIQDLREGTKALAQVSAVQWWDPILYGSGEPARIFGKGVSACFFEIFGAQPVVGRFFLPEEEELNHEPVVVLSYGLWQQRFGGDPGAVGQTLDLDGVRYTVVGVVPAGFVDPFGAEALIWRARPPEWDATRLARINHSWRAIGRLAEGVTLEQAQADVDRVWSIFRREHPESHSQDGARLIRAKEWLVGDVETAILILLGSVGLVLLIACANVANLFLTRTIVRGREISLRSALGASRGRIVRQLVSEVCLLFVIGGAIGLPVAWLGMNSLLALGAQDLPRLGEVGIDWVVLGFTLGISLLSGLIFGLAAALPAVRSDLAAALQMGGRSLLGDRKSQRVRAGLVVAEIALALLLLAGGGLLLRSLWILQRTDPGFQPENVLTLRVYPTAGSYTEPDEITSLYQDLTAQLASIPGVTVAGAINFLPMWAGQNCEFVWRDDLPLPTREEFAEYDGPTCLEVRVVTPDYFEAMGISVVRGRGFTENDDGGAPPVAVISAATADLGFRGEDPLGKRVTLYETRDYLPNVSRQVVGVVSNVRQTSLAAEGVPAIYFAHAQEPDPDRRRVMTLTMRAGRDLTDLAARARAAVWQVDDNITIDFVQPMTSVVSNTVAQPRFRTTLVLIFGAVALVLAMVGVAGVVGHAVSQRIPEIGIRIALGASDRNIYAAVMGHGIKLTVAGLLLGVGGALLSTKVLSSLLYGIPTNDPVSFVAASALLVAIALVAIWVPARRAVRVDPVKTLNAE
ncbi:MAG: ABC transporter permease [Gemmatimonadota bacterium]|nr:MAG: ABC transporter permease [Gemmatimonadota bacterium]